MMPIPVASIEIIITENMELIKIFYNFYFLMVLYLLYYSKLLVLYSLGFVEFGFRNSISEMQVQILDGEDVSSGLSLI